MEYSRDKIRGVLSGIVIGDALGAPLDGMSRAHINAVFKSVRTYMDPEPALKSHMERWRKPGLYSSISQLAIIFCLALETRRGDPEHVLSRSISEAPQVEGSEYGIFRNAGPMERSLFDRVHSGTKSHEAMPFLSPCAGMIPIIAPVALVRAVHANRPIEIIPPALVFNRDPLSLAGLLIFSAIIGTLAALESASDIPALADVAIEEAGKMRALVEEKSSEVFAHSLNPDTLLQSIDAFREIFQKVENSSGRRRAEETICTEVNRITKSHITRATVNHPLALVPFALSLCDELISRPGDILFEAAGEGGSASLTASLCGAIAGSAFGHSFIPENLLRDLVNRKRITAVIDAIADGNITEKTLQEFISSEAPLTLKELQERAAKVKHHPPAKKKPRSRKDMEMELSRHVIESWTKLDKAKWKKEKKKLEKPGEGE